MLRIKGDISNQYYQSLWDNIQLIPERVVNYIDYQSKKIIKNIDRYKSTETQTGVPWIVTAVIHMREADFSFDCNFLNGEALDQVTVLVPKGEGPFKTWEDSVLRSYQLQKNDLPKEWTIVSILLFLEKYNGLGYASLGKNSPYLWSMSNQGIGTGKFVDDGKYDPNAIDDQVGCATMIKYLQNKGMLNLKDEKFNVDIPVLKCDTTKSESAVELQKFLNKIIDLNKLGVNKLVEDGVAGKVTSSVVKKIFGFDLFGGK